MAERHQPETLLTGRLFGLEHEFSVKRAGRRQDFRRWIRRVARTSGRTIPAGPHAYFLPSGTLLSCDGAEAELSAPPEPVAPGLCRRVSEGAAARLDDLLRSLNAVSNPPLTLNGYSTHLSALCTGVDIDALANAYARTMAPGMMLLLDLPTSPGLLVRPRQRRFEVGGDYVPPGDFLGAATVFFLASFLATVDAVVRRDLSRLPLRFDSSQLKDASGRRGIYVERSAFGEDLYQRGRDALLRREDHTTIRAGDALELLWQHAETYARRFADDDERALVSRAVAGARPLPCEIGDLSAHLRPSSSGIRRTPRHAFAACLKPRRVRERRISPYAVTWDYVVYRVSGPPRRGFLNVPLASFQRWSADLAAGRAHRWLERPAMQALSSPGDADTAGMYDAAEGTVLRAAYDSRGKKQDEDALCQVIERRHEIDINIPRTMDPQVPKLPQEPPQSDWTVAHDVWAHNGSFHHSHVDHQVHTIGFNFTFVRAYRSAITYDGILGQNWDHFYNIRVVPAPPSDKACWRSIPGGWSEHFRRGCKGGDLTYYHGSGRVTPHAFASWEIRDVDWCDAQFTAVVTTYEQNPGESFYIERYAIIDGAPPPPLTEPIFYRIRFRGGTRVLLNCHGYVVQIRDRNMNDMQFSYGLPQNPLTGYFVLVQIQDTLQRLYELAYTEINGVPRIQFLTDPWGREVQFHYDTKAQLEKVSLVEGDFGRPQITYGYGTSGRPGMLERVINPTEAGTQKAAVVNHYDAQERIDRQDVLGEAPQGSGIPTSGGRFRIQYPSASELIVLDRSNVKWSYQLQALGNTKVVQSVTVNDQVVDAGSTVSKDLTTTYQHDANFHITEILYPSGRKETFSFRNHNALLLQYETEYDDLYPPVTFFNDLSSDDLEKHELIPSPTGGVPPTPAAPTLTTTFHYDPLFNTLHTTTSPSGTTVMAYDNDVCGAPERNGNAVSVTHPPQLLPDGSTLPVIDEMQYAPGGVLKYHKDPDGVEHSYIVNAEGRVEIYQVGGVTQEHYEYDDYGNAEWRYDARGNAWHEEHDDRDNCVRTVDPLNHEVTNTYDLNDRLTVQSYTIVDDATTIPNIPPLQAVSFTARTSYDVQGNRVSLSQTATGGGGGTLSRSWEWHYDANEALMLSRSPRAVAGDRADAETRFTYNARGNVANVTEADGGSNPGTTQTFYDTDARPVLIIDPMGERRTASLDGLGRPTLTELPGGTKIHREYHNDLLWREWIEGEISTGPPSLGFQQKPGVLDETQFTFDASQRVISRIEEVFDPLQRSTIGMAATGTAKSLVWYTAAGRVHQTQDPDGLLTVHKYDAQGREDTTTMPGGHTIGYKYDGGLVHQAIQTLQPDTGTTEQPPPTTLTLTETKVYDKLGRVIEATGLDGVKIQYAYNSVGRCRALANPLSLTVYEYDGLSRIARQVTDSVISDSNSSGHIEIKYGHDLNDNVTAISDGLRRTTRSRYDGRDQPTRIDEPSRPRLAFTRRADGKVTQVTRGGAAQRAQYEYLPGGDLQRVLVFDGTSRNEQAFGYDGASRMTWALDSNNTSNRNRVQTYRSIDSLGRLTSERTVIPEFGFDQTVTYGYGANFTDRTVFYPGNPQITYEIGADRNVKRITELGLPLVEKWHQGPGRLLERERYTTLTVQQPQFQAFHMRLREGVRYNAKGQLNRHTLRITDEINSPSPPSGPNYANLLPFGGAESLIYGDHGMISNRNFDDHSNEARYDGAGRLLWTLEEELPNRRLDEYDWDAASRLHKIEATEYTGKKLSSTTVRETSYPGTGPDRTDVIGPRVLNWQFDALSRLVQCAELHGGPSLLRKFSYDAADRLSHIAITRQVGSHTHHDEADYLYDAFGRRVARITGRPGQSLLNREREIFLFDGPNCILEFDRAGQDRRRYVYDEIGQIIAYDQRDPATGQHIDLLPIELIDGTPSMMLNRHMNVTTLPPPPGAGAAALTRQQYYRDSIPLVRERQIWRPFTGAKVYSYDYSSGTAAETVVPEPLVPVNGGRRVHAAESLYYNMSRFYDPDLQEFVTADPSGTWHDPHSLGSAHGSGANNPYMARDSGQLAFLIPLAIYIGTTLLIAAVETGIQYAIARATDSTDEFDAGDTFRWNVGLGLATNWIPGSAIGRVGGGAAARAGLRAAAAVGVHGALRFGARRLLLRASAWATRSIATGTIEYGLNRLAGRHISVAQIAAGHMVGGTAGAVLHPLLRRAVRGIPRKIYDTIVLRRARQWLLNPTVPVGGQRFIGQRQGMMMLREAAELGLDHEYGVIRPANMRTVLRCGDMDHVPFDAVETHIAHYHPPGGPWISVRRRLPAGRDIEAASWTNAQSTTGMIIARRTAQSSETVSTMWFYRPNGPLTLIVDHVEDLDVMTDLMRRMGCGQRHYSALIFKSLEHYQRVFTAYGNLLHPRQ